MGVVAGVPSGGNVQEGLSGGDTWDLHEETEAPVSSRRELPAHLFELELPSGCYNLRSKASPPSAAGRTGWLTSAPRGRGGGLLGSAQVRLAGPASLRARPGHLRVAFLPSAPRSASSRLSPVPAGRDPSVFLPGFPRSSHWGSSSKTHPLAAAPGKGAGGGANLISGSASRGRERPARSAPAAAGRRAPGSWRAAASLPAQVRSRGCGRSLLGHPAPRGARSGCEGTPDPGRAPGEEIKVIYLTIDLTESYPVGYPALLMGSALCYWES
ncbi:uncharacterized protein LOC141574139 [Camelus bactrianus]|uniref:Uncharacterized protein LOC141574139 n=1 Tax=Camelus bactrianus TaxID=9837 RepID=A0AC58P1X1_CAMBA